MSGGPAFPIIIAEFERNAREVVRVALDCYRGAHTIDVRVWYFSGRDLKPGKTGLTLSVRHVDGLADALAKAAGRARELRLPGVSE